MPLIKGKTKRSQSKNIRTLIHEGYKPSQAVAISYAIKRKAQRKRKHK